ncbi:unnamed protein product [Fraxinus pennsylvanica]|uniref:Uncharacterized protein n=1 Tax=Fraxinus pennsylvanica TaxID=56036 RepID=A0AAD2E4S2_9LAMI|nr:unnamed protein product [Fraxinus pennsylvanica]
MNGHEAMVMNSHHFLILLCPFQSHINPSLQLAKNLARNGVKVTLVTTNRGLKQMKSLPTLKGLSCASFSNEKDDDYQSHNGFYSYVESLRSIGSQILMNLIKKFSDEGQQCATAFTIYHRFFNSQEGIHGRMDPSVSIKVPTLPLFSSSDLPTFLLPNSPSSGFLIPVMKEHIQVLPSWNNIPDPLFLLIPLKN